MGYLYIFLTILFTVYGQLILKWRIGLKESVPVDLSDKFIYIFHVFTDMWVISGFVAAFIASISWIATLTKFEISFAYPFMSISFPVVMIIGVFVFGEQLTWQKIVGIMLIIVGLIILTRK